MSISKAQIEDIATKLRTWDALKSIGIKDVFGSEGAFYLTGPALRLEKYLQHMFKFEFNESFGRHFGIPVEVERWERSYRVRNTKPQWFQLPDNEGIPLVYVFEGIQAAINDILQIDGYEVEIELIVEPGYPWPGKDVEYFSAKEKKWYRSTKPDAAIKIESTIPFDDGRNFQWALNFCEILPTVCQVQAGRAVIGDMNGLEYMVTHASAIVEKKIKPEKEDYLKKCGGMVFPSLATGELPAANFGETILVAHPGLILPSLRPYKQRGQYPIVTYSSDVWTEVANDFVGGNAAIQAFKQLYGGENYMYAHHFWILGPTVKDTGFADEPVKPLESTKQVRTTIMRRAKLYTREISKTRFKELADEMSGDRYGYLESKAHIIVDWKCFVLAACPVQFLKRVQPVLEAFGYRGDLIGVEVSDEVAGAFEEGRKIDSETDDWLRYQYSWAASDAIRAYAHENKLVMNVSV